jgi:hypothetical protein
VLGPQGAPTEAVVLGLEWALKKRADIISMSLGIDFPALVDRLVEATRLKSRAPGPSKHIDRRYGCPASRCQQPFREAERSIARIIKPRHLPQRLYVVRKSLKPMGAGSPA